MDPLLPLLLTAWWVFHGLLAFLLSYRLRLASEAHWTVKAQLAWPLRLLAQTRFIEALAFALIASDKIPLEHPILYAGSYLLFLMGTSLIRELVARTLPVRTISWREALENANTANNPLFSISSLLAILTGLMWGQAPGPVVWITLSFTAAWQVFQALGGWLHLRKLTGRVRPAAPELVTRLAALVPEKIVVEEWNAGICQAMALLWSRTVLFTRPLLDRLPAEQVDAIFLHEVQHLREPLSVRLVLLATGASYSGVILLLPLIHSDSIGGALLVVYGWLGLNLFASRYLRRLERRSDEAAGLANPGAYAAALEHVYEFNLIPAVMPGKQGQAHPDLWDRMNAAGVVPSWPRPQPPGAWWPLFLFQTLAAVVVLKYW